MGAGVELSTFGTGSGLFLLRLRRREYRPAVGSGLAYRRYLRGGEVSITIAEWLY